MIELLCTDYNKKATSIHYYFGNAVLALYTLHIIGKLASNLSAYVVGLFMLVILACGIYQVCVRDWLNVAILFGVEAVCMVLQFSAMLLVELAGEWAGSLGTFLHS